ncbi:hypothetical protein M427DRAFT_58594 [Gonapodya prolifera JEL478]|uniref:Uncharacterized protein n=1 Tax=Gonapodya prolifera (strain JEL478) TaxID=1344416 RepID=A0A139A9U8_GONPJ|nr:hypothetical protein M427DRAFT_58594 [Gonapodya prolifera JEL478]|eukprot:KXS13556.1 hypothetical protein M427DRAFT_58594 [Gonapodya prolifera JEL478]
MPSAAVDGLSTHDDADNHPVATRFASTVYRPWHLALIDGQTNYLEGDSGDQHEVPSHAANLHLTYSGQNNSPPPNLSPEEAFAVVYGGTNTTRAVGDAKQYKSSKLINIISAGVGWWAMKEYEKRRQQQGLPPSNSQWAHKLIAAMASYEVARICQQLYADRTRDINDDIGSLPPLEELQKQLTADSVRIATSL